MALTAMFNNDISIAASTAASVANEFLRLAKEEPEVPPVDQMKLQKLLFYAHAWYLAIYSKPLFDADFEAWPWGPVIRDIYSQTRKYGTRPITNNIKEIQKVSQDSNWSQFDVCIPKGIREKELKTFIKEIWDVHKMYSGIQLSNSTHAPGEPWTIMKELYDLNNRPTIPNELIDDIFKRKLKNAAPTDSAA